MLHVSPATNSHLISGILTCTQTRELPREAPRVQHPCKQWTAGTHPNCHLRSGSALWHWRAISPRRVPWHCAPHVQAVSQRALHTVRRGGPPLHWAQPVVLLQLVDGSQQLGALLGDQSGIVGRPAQLPAGTGAFSS